MHVVVSQASVDDSKHSSPARVSRLRPTNQTKNSHKITNKFQNSKFKKKIMQIIDTLPPPTISMRTLVLHLSSIACLHKNCRFVWTKIFPKIVCLLRRFVAFNSSTNLNIFDYFVFRLISIFPILFLKKFPIFFQFFPIFFQFFFKKKQIFDFVVFCLNLLSTEPFTAPLIVQRASTSRPCDWSTPTRTFPKKVEFF